MNLNVKTCSAHMRMLMHHVDTHPYQETQVWYSHKQPDMCLQMQGYMWNYTHLLVYLQVGEPAKTHKSTRCTVCMQEHLHTCKSTYEGYVFLGI